jgi:hypothetical protein
MPPIWLRLAEAAGCSAAVALGMGLVVTYLADYLPFPTDQMVRSKLVMLFAFPSAMAFVIGACVPHIYRSARRAAIARRDEASRVVAPTPPVSQPSATEGSSIGRDDDGDILDERGRETAREIGGGDSAAFLRR